MRDLLFLTHRIPFPPNKGDKVRSFHMLRCLARHYRVQGTFIDDRDDWRYIDELRRYCADLYCVPLDPRRAKLLSLRGLLSGEPLTLPYYRDAGLRAWVERVIAEQGLNGRCCSPRRWRNTCSGRSMPGCVGSWISSMSIRPSGTQYAASKPWPLSWIYRREACACWPERTVAAELDASVFVTAEEAALFRQPRAGNRR